MEQPKREPMEPEVDLRRSATPIKREESPIDVDEFACGNKDEPIIIDSDSDADEVDAQMDEDDEAAQDELIEDVGEDSESVEFVDMEQRDRSVAAEEEGIASAETLSEAALDLPAKEQSREPSQDSSREASKEPSQSPVQAGPSTHSQKSTPVEAEDPDVLGVPKVGGVATNDTSTGSGRNSPSPEKDEDLLQEPVDPFSAPAEEQPREQTPAPRTPPPEEDREATPRPQVSASPASLPSSPEPEEPVDELFSRFIDFAKSKKVESAPPASQQQRTPASTKKRAFASLDASVPSGSQPAAKPAPRRREFTRIPATQPAATGAAGKLSFASQPGGARPQSISSDEEAVRQLKRAKTSASPLVQRKQSQAPRAPSQGSQLRARRATKHEDHWHIDGSVVLQFGGVVFRLHRSRLAQQSPFLAELFKDRDGKEHTHEVFGERTIRARLQGTMDEQPLYVVEGVAPDDFAKLLDALDNAINYVFTPPAFPDLAALLRASVSLSFHSLATFATRTLETMWPASLPDLEVHPHAEHAEETIVLARTCGLPSLLKRAFYELLREPSLGQSVEEEFLLDGAAAERARKKVLPADLARLIKTRVELVAQWARAAALPPDELLFPCAQKGSCASNTAEGWRRWREAVAGSELYVECMHDPVTGLARLCAIDWRAHGFCEGCVKAWRLGWRKQREKVWENLDLWLELPPKEEDEAL
ncbi:hypothetical protein PsYK624_067610 [Phanerochaete sordida]|uniref:BTB domain-containing protein n=1 Tax=Phanerochaete sordida TaxID=48140 RepID=A0A9P3G9P4_9APHY|nr:hypothetical protein PsYK624_067610 [Phanerochaete sordida]